MTSSEWGNNPIPEDVPLLLMSGQSKETSKQDSLFKDMRPKPKTLRDADSALVKSSARH